MNDARDIAGSGPQAVRIGSMIAGKYVVERVLGAGGMGVVLASRHAALGSPVAIKVLLPTASAIPGATERFLREARAAASLRSEHVARVMDVGVVEDGTPYLVMELLAGQDLRAVLRERGRLPVEDVATWIMQICDAIGEAHGIGIVHRDLKPGNLFLTRRPNGTALLKVLDFGLAKVLDGSVVSSSDASLTATGLVVGSPPYMPPEQLRSLKLADARSDIWSLGVILFELLTGEKPFKAERPEGLIITIATDAPPLPRSLRPDIPEPIEALILRCLRKAPEERPQSVREMAAILEPFTRPREEQPSHSHIDVGSRSASAPTPPRHSSASDTTRVADALTTPGTGLNPGALGAKIEPETERGGDATTLSLGAGAIGAATSDPKRRASAAWGIGGVAGGLLLASAVLWRTFLHDSPTPEDAPPVVASAPSAALTASPAVTVTPLASTSSIPTASSAVAAAGSGQATSPASKSQRAPTPAATATVPAATSSGAALAKPRATGNPATKARPEALNSWP